MTGEMPQFLTQPWISSLPNSWQVDRLANVAEILFSNVDKHTLEDETPVALCNYVDVYKNDRIDRRIAFMSASAEEREIRRFQLQKHDVLVTKDSESPDDIVIGALVVEELPGVLCGYHLAMIRPRENRLSGGFLAWLFADKQFRGHFEAHAAGVTRFGLSQSIFRAAQVPLPKLSEQHHIAAYLDASCAAIDAAVAAKRRQIGTLDALRESRIERAITHGLQESSMQPVGLDWIESLPIHWKAVRVKRVLAAMDYGISVSTNDEGRFPVLKMGHIQNGEIEYAKLDYVDDVPETLLLEENDVLYNRTNSPDQVGKAAIFRKTKGEAITFASYLVRLRLNHRVLPEFFNYVANSVAFLGFARRMAIPSVQQSNLNSTRYGRLWIPLPPLEEQHCIVNSLNAMSLEVHATQSVLRKQIDTLTAYRKSLIHECVTGQRRIGEAELAAAGLAP